jgi:Heavy metal binding domain
MTPGKAGLQDRLGRRLVMAQGTKDTVYTCPMHPDVRRTEPGTCPQCGMQLEPLREEEAR